MVKDNPSTRPSYWRLPAGIVVGLRHSETQANRTDITTFGRNPVTDGNFDGFIRRHGGDLNGSTNEGFYWYESTDEYFSDGEWGIAESLSMGTVLGLQHSETQSTPVYWKDTAYYPVAPMDAPTPEGFKRRHGGDQGAAPNEGYYWFEMVSGPSPFSKEDNLHCDW